MPGLYRSRGGLTILNTCGKSTAKAKSIATQSDVGQTYTTTLLVRVMGLTLERESLPPTSNAS